MRKALFGVVTVVLCLASQTNAQVDPCFSAGVPFAGESITVSTSALGLTAATYDQIAAGTGPFKASAALLCVNTNAINYRVDGTAPTSAVGLALSAGSCVCIGTLSLPKMSMIRSGASDSVVFAQYIAPPL